MSYSKRQFVTAALEEIGLASYVFDMQPEDLQSAVRRLDAMMAEWNGKGLRLSYPIPGSPENTDLDAETNVPDSANEAIITNLAIRLAPSYGKIVARETKTTAKQAYNTVLMRSTKPPEKQMPANLPVGAGYKTHRTGNRPFANTPVDNIDVGSDSELELY